MSSGHIRDYQSETWRVRLAEDPVWSIFCQFQQPATNRRPFSSNESTAGVIFIGQDEERNSGGGFSPRKRQSFLLTGTWTGKKAKAEKTHHANTHHFRISQFNSLRFWFSSLSSYSSLGNYNYNTCTVFLFCGKEVNLGVWQQPYWNWTQGETWRRGRELGEIFCLNIREDWIGHFLFFPGMCQLLFFIIGGKQTLLSCGAFKEDLLDWSPWKQAKLDLPQTEFLLTQGD